MAMAGICEQAGLRGGSDLMRWEGVAAKKGRLLWYLPTANTGDVWVRDPVSNTLMEFQDMYGNPHQLRLELTDDPLLVRIHR